MSSILVFPFSGRVGDEDSVTIPHSIYPEVCVCAQSELITRSDLTPEDHLDAYFPADITHDNTSSRALFINQDSSCTQHALEHSHFCSLFLAPNPGETGELVAILQSQDSRHAPVHRSTPTGPSAGNPPVFLDLNFSSNLYRCQLGLWALYS